MSPDHGSEEPQVAYVVPKYPSVTATFVQREIRAVERCGVRVNRFSINPSADRDALAARDREERTRTVYIKSMPKLTIASRVVGVLLRHPGAFTASLGRALRAARWDLRLVILHFLYFIEGLLVWFECERRGCRHLHAHFGHGSACVAWFAADLGNSVSHGRDKWTWSFTVHGWREFLNEESACMRQKVESAALTVAIADHTRSQLMRLSSPAAWPRIVVERMGVELSRLPFQPRAKVSSSPTILTVARLAPEKGHLVLFEALAILVQRGRHVTLRLAGEGPCLDMLVDEVARLGLRDHVSFLGAIGQDELTEVLDSADVFCLPSFSEGIPVSLMEAMARGRPVVTTAINGVPELVIDGVTGLTVRPARPDLLADAIERLLVDDALRSALVCAARSHVESEFDVEVVGPRVAARLRQLVRP